MNSSGSARHSDANGREVGRARTSGTILVVDDELAVRRLFSAALKRRGFETLEAEDGPSALNVIASTPVDLVLIDHNMPGMTGMQVLKEIRSEERTRTLPVIMVTGEDGTPSRIRGLDVGANDYVVKTTHIDELVARVRAQLRTTVAWAELISHELQDRARLVTALGAVTAADSPEATAAALVDRLAGLDGVAFIALLQADPTGGLTPLAGWTATKGPWVGGQSLARSTSKQFLSRAEAGPWTEATSEQPSQHTGRFLPSEVAAIHAAPLRLADRVVGMLVLGTPRVSTPLAPTGDLLAAAIDYAAVATAVLGPALKARGQMTSERSRLERIIAEGAFHPVFQPLVGLSDGEVIGYEALTRFADGVPPDVRFAEAARVGLRRMYEQATLTAALEAAQELPEGKWLGVNVSPELVLEPDWLADCLKGSTRRLVVELTEHAPIDDYAKLREMLETLPTRVAVAVDDAGAGYASLRHIYELRPHFVKLDIGLVRGVNKDPLRQALIAGLVHFADDTGSRLIAEGIETEAEAATMRRLHVRIGQGFLFGRPAQVEPRRAETDAEALPAGRPSA